MSVQTLEALLDGTADGVYRFRPQTPAPVPTGPLRHVLVPVQAVREKSAFLAACAGALAFPPHFGHNWDAFYDCMTDAMSGLGPAALVVFDDLTGFAQSAPAEFEAAVDALADAAEFWRERGGRLVVLAGMSEPLAAPELPEISLR